MAQMVRVPFGHTSVQRIVPQMPVQAYKTYGMSMPLASHWRPATCEEVDCEAYRAGWVTTIDLDTELGRKQYHYCTHEDRSRSYSEQRVTMTLVKLLYKPGNRCFRSGDHRLPLERPVIFSVRGGDWRAATTSVRTHVRAEDWIDDFAEHQDKLATAFQRG